MLYLGLITMLALWAADKGRWAFVLLALICYFE
jgi:hypothetical protein